MVDLHHHLLPGLDDGPKDIETSLAMARMAAADGITHIVATPHANTRYPFTPARNSELIEEIRQTLRQEGVSITLGLGCDFHLSYENIQDALAHPTKYALNGTEYVLIELPDYIIPPRLDDSIYELRLAGIVPVLTHPERNPALQKNTARLAEWLRTGMLVQITTSSVLGQMGSTAERMAHRLLADRWVHFLATDAHNLDQRPPKMRAAYDLVAKKYGAAYAERICVENPLAVFEGRPLPPQDEALRLYTERERPWWKRAFGV